MKTPVLPLLLGLSLCGIGGAMLYVYFKNKDDEADRNQSESDSDIVDAPNRVTSKSSLSSAKPILNGKPKVPEKEINREIVIENDVVPIVVGRNLSNLKLIEDVSGSSIQFKDKNDGKSQICCVKGRLDAVAKAEDLIKESIKRANRVTEEILVPQSACGKIMGRCGDSLQEISRKSKAKVSIESGDRGDGKTRRVFITGNQSQVNIAKLLIEEKVKEDEIARRIIEDAEAKREPRGGLRTPTGMTPATSRESIPQKFEKLSSTSSDGQLEVYVSAIASPAKFWLQIVGPQTSELDLLVETLTDYYNQPANQELHKIREPYLGQIVAAMFKHDGKWYRAEIISILPNEYSPNELVLDLYFVDYGDSQYVGPHEIFELRTDFLMLRFQAIECFLAHVQPRFGNDPELWDYDAISRFEEMTHVGQWKKMLSRTVTYKERTKGDTRIRREGSPVPGVELYDSNDGGDINIADELVKGYAIYTPEAQQERNHFLSFDSPTSSQSSSMYENFPSSNNVGGSGGGLRTTNLLKNDTNSSFDHPSNSTLNQNNNNNNLINFINGGGPSFNLVNDNDKFSAIFENTTNENYENTQKDSTTPTNSISHQLLEAERTNGNYVPSSVASSSSTTSSSNGVANPKRLFPKDWNEMIEDERRGVL